MLPLEEAIIENLQGGPCWFDEIVVGLPNFSWGEIFVAIDCMSRDGRVCLHRLGYSTYQISLGSAKRADCWEQPRSGRSDEGWSERGLR
jgi:hypothetical protein